MLWNLLWFHKFYRTLFQALSMDKFAPDRVVVTFVHQIVRKIKCGGCVHTVWKNRSILKQWQFFLRLQNDGFYVTAISKGLGINVRRFLKNHSIQLAAIFETVFGDCIACAYLHLLQIHSILQRVCTKTVP